MFLSSFQVVASSPFANYRSRRSRRILRGEKLHSEFGNMSKSWTHGAGKKLFSKQKKQHVACPRGQEQHDVSKNSKNTFKFGVQKVGEVLTEEAGDTCRDTSRLSAKHYSSLIRKQHVEIAVLKPIVLLQDSDS